jgi:spore germination cell wall hydrolase CwlJ-like protein
MRPRVEGRLKYRICVAACVAIVCLVGCRRAEVDDSQPPPSTGRAATEKKAAALEQKAAATGNKVTSSPSELINQPEAQAVDPAGREPLDDAITCLARTVYWEARGEATVDMEAIANVVMNRLGHEGFPKTICGVVRQGQERGSCQFSWWCDGRSDRAKEDDSYATAKEIARKALNLQLIDRTGGSLYFHQQDATPGWAAEYTRTVKIGEFVFYKPRGGRTR